MSNILALDIETIDPNLKTLGNGAIRKDGRVLGIGVYDGTRARYFQVSEGWVNHEVKEILGNPANTLVMHNSVYDADWLQNGMGLPIRAKIADTQTRAGLINEYHGRYNLEACCERAGIEGKGETELQQWWADNGGKGDVKAHMDEVPVPVVEKYCIQDCIATFNLFQHQAPMLKAMRLEECADLESAQLPFVLEMRKNGIRVNVPQIQMLTDQTQREIDEGLAMLESKYGITSLRKQKGPGSRLDAFERLGLVSQLNRTATGKPSLDKISLARVSHPLADELFMLQNRQSLMEKTLTAALVDYRIGDRIHGTFKPTLQDEGGTITGRYSSSKPNMQQFPSRADTGGDLIRSLFLPDEGCILGAFDYKQVEYRLLAHFAVGPGAEALREAIRSGADYHDLVQKMLGWDFPDARKLVKNFNFGSIYGLGLNSFIAMFMRQLRPVALAQGMSVEELANKYRQDYFRRMTYIRPTMNAIQVIAKQHGSIPSVGGRIHHLPPDGRDYAILNYLIQGSAADIMKMGIRDAWEAGCFNELKAHLTVHDELVFSIPPTKAACEAAEELARCMTDCVKLTIPLGVDKEAGFDWWNGSNAEYEKWRKGC